MNIETHCKNIQTCDKEIAALTDKLNHVKKDAAMHDQLQAEIAELENSIRDTQTKAYLNNLVSPPVVATNDIPKMQKKVVELKAQAQNYKFANPALLELSAQLVKQERLKGQHVVAARREIQGLLEVKLEHAESSFLKASETMSNALVEMQSAAELYSLLSPSQNDQTLTERYAKFARGLNVLGLQPQGERGIAADKQSLAFLAEVEALGFDATNAQNFVNSQLSFKLNPQKIRLHVAEPVRPEWVEENAAMGRVYRVS